MFGNFVKHGEEECILNALEACAIRTWPDPKLHYWFIRCVENDMKDWESCVKKHGGEKAINYCYNGDLSKKSVQSIADFVVQTCKAYKGKAELPKLCKSSALMPKSPERKVPKLQVSYAD